MARVGGTITDDGNSAVYSDPVAHRMSLRINGTWRSATVALYERGVDSVYRLMPSGTFTANTSQTINVIPGAKYRLTCSGSGSPQPDLYYEMAPN
jgi:hypothetical protein